MDSQLQSPLFDRLPGELRNLIYAYSLTAKSSIIDPSYPPSILSRNHHIPNLGAPLLRVCKRIYNEVSLHSLYTQNIFRFTSTFSAHYFISQLKAKVSLIQDIEIDLREVSDAYPSVAQEWIHYLSWSTDSNNLWTKKLGSLRNDAPNLRTLRLNIERWRFSGSFRSIALLEDILRGPSGLDSVIITGMDGSELLLGGKAKYLEHWGPVVFVGVMQFAKLAGMMGWMAECVKGEREKMVVRWMKEEGTVSLGVSSWEAFNKENGRGRCQELLASGNQTAEGGCCSLTKYEKRWHSGEWPITGSQ